MSVSYSPTPAVSFPARRTPIRPAQDTPLATVRDIAPRPSDGASRRSGRTIPLSCDLLRLLVDVRSLRAGAWLQALSLPSRFP